MVQICLCLLARQSLAFQFPSSPPSNGRGEHFWAPILSICSLPWLWTAPAKAIGILISMDSLLMFCTRDRKPHVTAEDESWLAGQPLIRSGPQGEHVICVPLQRLMHTGIRKEKGIASRPREETSPLYLSLVRLHIDYSVQLRDTGARKMLKSCSKSSWGPLKYPEGWDQAGEDKSYRLFF